jgi:tyrosine-protein kinase Etk/Wzc
MEQNLNYGNKLPEEDNIDIKRYLSLFISNWYWFAITLFIAMSIAYGINRWSEEIYTVSASLLIADEQYGGDMSQAEKFLPGSDIFSSQQNLKNEIGILKSFSLNYEVMKKLPEFWVTYMGVGRRGIAESRQYKSSPFKVFFDSLECQAKGRRVNIKILSDDEYSISIGDRIEKTMKFSERYTDLYNDFYIVKHNEFRYDDDESNKYYFWFNSLEGLANQYRSKLSILPIEEEASLVTLLTSGFSAQQEADYLNKLMEVYIDRGLELKNETADNTIEFINEQIGFISDSLMVAESNLESFRLNNELIDLSSEASILQSRTERYENEKYGIEFEKQYYEYLLEYINSRDESGEIVSPSLVGITDPILSRLIVDIADLQQQMKQVSFSIRDDLPTVNLMDTHLADARKILKENVENSLKNATKLLDDANARIARVEAEIQKLPGTERQLINIQRKFDLNNTIYNYLLEKRAEAGIAKASNVSDNRIIDRAESFNSTQISPQIRRNYVMAIIFGLLIPAILILLIDYLNNKIIDKKDIERGTSAPVMGFVSHNNLQTEIPVKKQPGSTLAESFRSLRTNLKYFTKDTQTPVIAVSSTISSEGKTFISANLAAIIASNGKKVLLVGLDLRKPRIHKIFGINNDTGISNYLIGQEKYENIIFQTEVDNLCYSPSGPVPPNPAELIDSPEMKEFIVKIKKQFDYIIIDTPPVALVTDALLVSPFTDLYLFVVRQRYSSKNTIELVEELRKNSNIKSLGIVINDISLTGYYGYGLRYGYSMGYGYSYGYNYYGDYTYSRYGYSDSSKGYYSNES